ncbi:MAG TPA: von Willebrand factor type A domain-containing protein [Mucilaginibacter sp.]|nr:von Willebrand factor type A domain-containing protein [Mucilaginibacter sp.]
MKNYLIIFIALIGLSSFRSSSLRIINGTVYNATNKTIISGVHIVVEGTHTDAYTNAQGHYSIAVPADKTRLVFSAAGYETSTISLNNNNRLDVYLNQVIYKMDTVAYRAAPYNVNPNATPDELLRKMEGIQVGADGNAVSQGRQITKARINGKDFVGGNVQAAAKHLPANIALREVQIVDAVGNQTSVTRPAPSIFPNNRTRNDAESYGRIIENQFTDPKVTPLSTFAVDVDAASYANIRRFINNGQLPPKNAVRIEEMINYFHYDLPEPTNGEPVAIKTELSTAPWNPQHQLVRIGLKAKNVKTDKLPPSNLVFLIDVSGSMFEANKLPLVKTAMKMLVDQLRPNDHVAIVVYASEVGIKLASTPGDQKVKIKDVIDQLGAGGGTAGGAGISMAYQVARQNFIKGGNNRIILTTDGDFNVGPSSNKDMEQLIEEERGSGVSISILGFGMGNLKDSKMERMADKGHGNYAYIDNITEATKSMVTEFGGTLFTVAKDVKLQVEFNPANVQAYRLLGYEDRLMAKEDFNNDTKVAGDMGVGHTVTALYEIIPAGVKDSFTGSVDPLKYQKVARDKPVSNSPGVMTVKFRYKQPDSEVSKMESVVVNNKPIETDKTSEDFRFAAAVAEYGMLLRNSQFKQNSRFDQLIKMAKGAKGKDEDGYRSEFIRLAESTMNMMKSTAQVVNE